MSKRNANDCVLDIKCPFPPDVLFVLLSLYSSPNPHIFGLHSALILTSELGSDWLPLHFCPSQIGVWNSQTGLNLTETSKDSSTNVTDSMANRTLIVTTILVRKHLHRCRERFGYF